MSLAFAGYSTRPLFEKLGYKEGHRVAFVALPSEFAELAEAVPFAAVTSIAGWNEALPPRNFDVIHAFTTRRADLNEGLGALQQALKPNGMIWVSWPKKAGKVATDVTEDWVRNAALKLDLVDVKVAAIDAVWSGLKLVIRRDRRADVGGER
jgi:hypothetical protein